MLADKLGSTSLLVLNVIDFMEKMVGLRSVNQVLQDDAIERLGTFLEPYKKKSNVKILSKIVKGEPYSVIWICPGNRSTSSLQNKGYPEDPLYV